MIVSAFVRLSKAIVAAVLSGVVILLAAYWIGPEHLGPLSLAQYVPYPVYLLPAIVSVGFSLVLDWRWRVAAGLSLLLVASGVMGLSVARGERGVDRVRLLTYNVKDYLAMQRDEGLVAVAGEIVRHDPDLFVLEDAHRFSDIRKTAPDAARLLFDGRHTFEFGQYVIASRFPLKECGHGEIPFPGESHTYASCVVSGPGGDFTVIAVHFMTPRMGLTAARRHPLLGLDEWAQSVSERMTQAVKLAADIRPRNGPVVVAGDFNAPTTSLVVRTLLEGGLRDAFSSAATGYGYTWGDSLRTRFSFLRLDHILTSPEFTVGDCFVGDAGPSPHRPVIADLYLSRR